VLVHIEARMDVKGFLCWVVVVASKRAGAWAGGCTGWASDGHDRDKPPTDGGGTLVAGHTWCARSGYVIEVEGGRSFVAQPEGVSRFDRARPRPRASDGSWEVFEHFSDGVAFQDLGDLSHGFAFITLPNIVIETIAIHLQADRPVEGMVWTTERGAYLRRGPMPAETSTSQPYVP